MNYRVSGSVDPKVVLEFAKEQDPRQMKVTVRLDPSKPSIVMHRIISTDEGDLVRLMMDATKQKAGSILNVETRKNVIYIIDEEQEQEDIERIKLLIEEIEGPKYKDDKITENRINVDLKDRSVEVVRLTYGEEGRVEVGEYLKRNSHLKEIGKVSNDIDDLEVIYLSVDDDPLVKDAIHEIEEEAPKEPSSERRTFMVSDRNVTKVVTDQPLIYDKDVEKIFQKEDLGGGYTAYYLCEKDVGKTSLIMMRSKLREAGTQKDLVASFLTDLGSKRYIDYSKPEKVLGKGNYGTVTSQYVFTERGAISTEIGNTLRAVKVGKEIESEKLALENMWGFLRENLSADELKLVRGIQSIHTSSFTIGTETYLEGEIYSGGNITNAFDASPDVKNSISYALIEGLFWLHFTGMSHWDIKPENCLYGDRGAVIADFGGVEKLSKKLPIFTPIFTDRNTLKEYDDALDKTKVLDLQKKGQSFSMGATLYVLYCKQLPYSEGKFGFPNLTYPDPKMVARLTNAGCDSDITYFIVRLLSPDSKLRPNDQEIAEFIVTHNPTLKPLLSRLVRD